MFYRRFGRTERSISAFSLGTMRLVHHPYAQARQILLTALQAGINHIETAQAYGHSEIQLGQLLRELWTDPTLDLPPRTELILTSKVSPQLSAQDLWQGIEGSLTRLQVESLDAMAFHGINQPDHLDQVLKEGLPTLKQAVDQGLVRHIGCSTHGPLELILRTLETDAFDFINLHYYYFNQHNAPALTAAQDRDMGVFIISPADKGGMLYRPPAALVDLCAPLSPLEFGYRFLLQDPRIHTLSLGAETPTQIHQALQCLAPLDTPEDGGDLEVIESRLRETAHQQLGTDRCAQCYACLPCPVSIPIPEILRLRNLAVAYDMAEYGQYRYNMLGQAGHWFPGKKGNHCTECGECLPRCPEDLSIPRLLFDAHERLNCAPLRRLWE